MSTGVLSQTTYATRRKDLLAVIDQLRANGSQDELDLPKIAVIGNQSAGKSSIVEAISGISVPRDGGTCTRCAFECRLSPAAEWSCLIKIRREFDVLGARLMTGVCEVPFGSLIKNKEEVEFRLRLAQVAVLKGQASDKQALVMMPDQVKQFQEEMSAHAQGPIGNPFGLKPIPRFSKNAICVHLQGPEYTDLAFVDLPGLIAAEDRETVQLVEDIVLSRIQGNCLILLALPMSDDMVNQKALQLARQVDPTGQRTIGVLTKPDMLTSGSLDAHDFWVKVLSGAGPYALKRGYFCSKQPDDQQRRSGITPADARKAERDFFAGVEPWARIADNQISGGIHLRDRFGLPSLVASLSDSLVEIIGQSLPRLELSAERLLKQSQDEYNLLPKAPSSEPFAEVLQMVTAFSQDITARVQSASVQPVRQGSGAARPSNPNQLIHENRDTFSRFKEHIYGTRPLFRPCTKKDRQGYGLREVDTSLRDEEDDASEAIEGIRRIDMDLDDVRSYIASSTTRELPGNVPYAAKVALITSVQATWPESTRTCADAIRTSLLQALHECAEERFKSFPGFHRLIKSAFTELVEKRFESCLATIHDIVETEQSPFTQNHHYLTSCTETWLSRYKEARARIHSQPLAPASKAPSRSDFFAMPPAAASFQPVVPSSPMFALGVKSDKSKNGMIAAPSIGPSSSKAQQIPASPVGSAVSLNVAQTSSNSTPAPSAIQPEFQQPHIHALNSPSLLLANSLPPREEKFNALFVALADLGYRGLKEGDLARLNLPDEYETEMKVMAEVRGYFMVSFKRVIDVIPMLIDLKFVRAIAGEMQKNLLEKLALGNEDVRERCVEYLRQDPVVERRREELEAMMQRMKSAQVELRRLK
ncbi:hypothetical protein BDN72DRAFT_959668 [Pluteus cervinus]|uniref:Uncharacterized protein n=1 Tax=Pluteus cervinus TaxID=181527 RepID=A0ACD3AUK5_9AGAR|nr:hypothetical protein BDN72DRAFT_959668 [Pluteus cervinus]